MLVSVPAIAFRNENTRNRTNTTIGGAPAQIPMIAKTATQIHCGGTVNRRRPALSINSIVTTTARVATIDNPTPPANPPLRPYFCSTLSAKVPIAKYGVTTQNQNTEANIVARQYC